MGDPMLVLALALVALLCAMVAFRLEARGRTGWGVVLLAVFLVCLWAVAVLCIADPTP